MFINIDDYEIILNGIVIFVVGHPSAYSRICCSPSLQSPSVETILDSRPFRDDVCHADKPEGVDRHGPPETCQLVRQ